MKIIKQTIIHASQTPYDFHAFMYQIFIIMLGMIGYHYIMGGNHAFIKSKLLRILALWIIAPLIATALSISFKLGLDGLPTIFIYLILTTILSQSELNCFYVYHVNYDRLYQKEISYPVPAHSRLNKYLIKHFGWEKASNIRFIWMPTSVVILLSIPFLILGMSDFNPSSHPDWAIIITAFACVLFFCFMYIAYPWNYEYKHNGYYIMNRFHPELLIGLASMLVALLLVQAI